MGGFEPGRLTAEPYGGSEGGRLGKEKGLGGGGGEPVGGESERRRRKKEMKKRDGGISVGGESERGTIFEKIK